MEPIRVLHVDDEPDFAETAAIYLERELDRLEVDPVTSATAGLERLDQAEYHCVVSDYDMPERSGIEFLEAVRETYPDLPFVLFTGKGSEELASEAICAGVTDYLQKEGSTEQYELLANRIENAVGQYRAERKLEETERWYRRLIEEATDVIGVLDRDGTIQYVSPAVEHVLGYDGEELVGARSWDFVHPADRESARETFEGLIDAADRRITHEFRFEGADGSWIWLEVRVRNVLEDELFDGVVVYARDVTERKERESELREKTSLLENLFEQVPIHLYVKDTDARHRWISEHLDWTPDPETAIGKTDRELYQTSGEETYADDLQVMETGEPIIDKEEHHPSFDAYTLTSKVPWYGNDDEVEGLIGVTKDITERKQLEFDLEERAALLDQIFEHIPISLYLKDTEGRHVRVDRTHPKGADAIGKTDVELWDTHHAMQTFADDMHVVETGDPIHRKEERGAATGQWMLTSKSPWYDESGNIKGIIGATLAIDERKRYERELERQNERLEEFASTVSHDLRNPLNVVQGCLELAREECDSEHLDSATDALGRCFDLIEDLLTKAREAEPVVDVSAVDLGSAVRTAWNHVSTGDATLAVETDRTIQADRARLERLLENLLRNAVEHGGESVTITVGDLDDGFYLEDDGSGIPEHVRDRLFEQGITTAADGTGFGLAIVDEIVHAHEWEIRTTESQTGGARFEITGVDETTGTRHPG